MPAASYLQEKKVREKGRSPLGDTVRESQPLCEISCGNWIQFQRLSSTLSPGAGEGLVLPIRELNGQTGSRVMYKKILLTNLNTHCLHKTTLHANGTED